MITSPLLNRTCGYINGQWTALASARGLRVINPATGELLAEVPAVDEAEVAAAIDAARVALAPETSLERRAEWLRGLSGQLLAHRDELGRIITLEHGKPLREGIAEVEYAAGFFRVCADLISQLGPRALPEVIRGCRWTVHYRPAGVAALISPWNFPLAMLAKKLSAALAAGCAVVAKPASKTPLSAIAFWALAERVGIPPGILNLVVGPSGPIGRQFCRHPAVRIISFTGSTEVGRQLMLAAAPGLKRLALELGGNAPFIVFDDADLAAAADGLMASKFRSAGQTCVCANRVYVHRRAHEAFVEIVAERVRRLRVGDGLDPQTDIGPLIDRQAFDKVSRHVQDALDRGARLIVGGAPPRADHDWGCFFAPTLMTDVTPDTLICREETFGPVVGISRFDDEAAVIEEANGTPYGLAAYLYTRDPDRAARVIQRLRFGHVGLNTGTGPTPEAPFGGMKESGFGREGGLEGLLEFTEPQTIAQA